MTIIHDKIDLVTCSQAVTFANLLGISCSVCAPEGMSAAAVEAFADADVPWRSGGGRWRVVDKATIGLGSHTPNPCNHCAGRLHWFLLSTDVLFEE